MNNVTRTVITALCAALVVSACCKKHHTAEGDNDTVPLCFTASSQEAAAKSLAQNSLANYHTDFGVYGIARQEGNSTPYVLWEDDAMAEVYAEETQDAASGEERYTGAFIPRQDAWWLNNYTYSFIAVAPYIGGVKDLAVTHPQDYGKDALGFTFDMSSVYSYDGPDYDFDLMGAVAHTVVEARKPAEQELVFRHLFAKINLKIKFVNQDKTEAEGTVSRMRLCNVGSKAEYTLTFDDDNGLNATCQTSGVTSEIIFDGSTGTLKDNGGSVHILPQDVSGFELYIDFERDGVSFKDFRINLNTAENSTYSHNQVYNWNITISPKNAISFSVTVNPWTETRVNGDDIQII